MPGKILMLKTRQDVDDLVADLRQAARRSERTGGTYGVYRKNGSDAFLLAVEITLPPRLGGRAEAEGDRA